MTAQLITPLNQLTRKLTEENCAHAEPGTGGHAIGALNRLLYMHDLKEFWCVVDTNDNLACINTPKTRRTTWLYYQPVTYGEGYDWLATTPRPDGGAVDGKVWAVQ